MDYYNFDLKPFLMFAFRERRWLQGSKNSGHDEGYEAAIFSTVQLYQLNEYSG